MDHAMQRKLLRNNCKSLVIKIGSAVLFDGKDFDGSFRCEWGRKLKTLVLTLRLFAVVQWH